MKYFLDLETTDTIAGAGIWEIGLVVCEDTTLEIVGDHKWTVSPDRNGSKSHSTLEWLASKSDVWDRYIQAELGGLEEVEALREITTIIRNSQASGTFKDQAHTWYSWGTFDMPILSAAFKRQLLHTPWHYRSECDLRSVARFLNSNSRPDTSLHDALEDAKALRKCYIELLKELELKS